MEGRQTVEREEIWMIQKTKYETQNKSAKYKIQNTNMTVGKGKDMDDTNMEEDIWQGTTKKYKIQDKKYSLLKVNMNMKTKYETRIKSAKYKIQICHKGLGSLSLLWK